jgi:hypothetical protein
MICRTRQVSNPTFRIKLFALPPANPIGDRHPKTVWLMEVGMLRACAIALSLAVATLAGVQAVLAQAHQSRHAKSLHAKTLTQLNKNLPPQGMPQSEKSWMDRASAASSGGGGGGM